MRMIVRALLDHKGEDLWYSKLRRLVRSPEYLGPLLSDSSFRKAMRKLREVGIIAVEKPSPTKKKRLLIYLLQETVQESSVPYSYTSNFGRRLFNQAADSGEHVRRQRHKDTEKRKKITQSLLFRANAGAVYPRRITNSEVGPGQVVSFKDKKGYWYYNEFIEANFTAEQMKELNPISSEFDTVDGISVEDLVFHKDAGSGRVFWDLKAFTEEAESVAKQLVNKGYLKEMSREEISEAIERTAKPARYEQLKEEKRYKVANEVLQEYIFHLTDLLHFITRRIQAACMARHKNIDSNWYLYYYGNEALQNLRTYRTTEGKRALAARKDGVTKIATPFGIVLEHRPRNKKSYEKEIREWDEDIRKEFDTLKTKKEYAQLRNEYPLLRDILLSMVKPISKNLKLDVNSIMTE